VCDWSQKTQFFAHVSCKVRPCRILKFKLNTWLMAQWYCPYLKEFWMFKIVFCHQAKSQWIRLMVMLQMVVKWIHHQGKQNVEGNSPRAAHSWKNRWPRPCKRPLFWEHATPRLLPYLKHQQNILISCFPWYPAFFPWREHFTFKIPHLLRRKDFAW